MIFVKILSWIACFILGAVCCYCWVDCQVEKLKMYIDPHGNGVFLLMDGHLAGLSKDKETSFDVLLKESGFSFHFFRTDTLFDYDCHDTDGDGLPDKIFLHSGDATELKKRLCAVEIIECDSESQH